MKLFQVEAVNLIEQNKAPCVPQTEEGASFEPSLKKKDLQKVVHIAIVDAPRLLENQENLRKEKYVRTYFLHT